MLVRATLTRPAGRRGLARWWLWSPGLASVVALGLAWALAACATRPATTFTPWTTATTPYAALPANVRGLQLPGDAQAVNALALALPAQVAGRVRLPQAERSGADGIGLAYGELDGTSGQLPLRLDVLDVSRSATAGGAATVAGAVLRELNDARMTHGPWSGGRDGQLLWFEQSSVGYRLVWGRADGQWLFVASAPDATQLGALLAAFGVALGAHGGQPARLH
jgi:hypothetical protein